MNEFFKPKGPTFRRATQEDFDALYSIWMQDHINPFMSFEQLSKEEFKPIFDKIFNASDVYVIEDESGVVAVRRIIYGAGEDAHTAYFASFGVDDKHLNKGYGSLFYRKFLEMLAIEKPYITRVELTQETDNPTGALYLATKKFGFSVWGVFPEWQPRKTGPEEYINKWLAAERFLEKQIDSTSFQNSIDSKIFTPKIPSLLGTDNNIQISFSDKVMSCYQAGQLIATCKIDNGVRRFGHIQFWSVKLEPDCNLEAAEQFLREIAMLTKHQFKKIEIFSHDPNTIQILENLGFHYRGQKHASCKIEDTYYNQTGSDLSFYNIEDAKKVLEKSKNSPDSNDFILVLDHCKEEINKALEKKIVDKYGQTYLENLAFQMVREVHSEHLYSEKMPLGAN